MPPVGTEVFLVLTRVWVHEIYIGRQQITCMHLYYFNIKSTQIHRSGKDSQKQPVRLLGKFGLMFRDREAAKITVKKSSMRTFRIVW